MKLMFEDFRKEYFQRVVNKWKAPDPLQIEIAMKDTWNYLEAEQRAALEPGPCGKHPKMFWNLAETGAENGLPAYCILCAEIAAAYERGKQDSAEICRAKAVYANRSAYGKEEFAKGLLAELENILYDTAKNIASLQDRGAGGGK